MESAGALSFFTESLAKYNVRYSHYIGDGDTESYKNVVKAKPYGDDLVPIKIECVGHVQKWLGTRLRQIRCDLKGKKLNDRKIISGKGRLTDKIINKMQNFYGMSIRQNTLAAWSGNHNKDTFLALRSDDLLSRCLDGATQNPNEALNQIIWKKCPKTFLLLKRY